MCSGTAACIGSVCCTVCAAPAMTTTVMATVSVPITSVSAADCSNVPLLSSLPIAANNAIRATVGIGAAISPFGRSSLLGSDFRCFSNVPGLSTPVRASHPVRPLMSPPSVSGGLFDSPAVSASARSSREFPTGIHLSIPDKLCAMLSGQVKRSATGVRLFDGSVYIGGECNFCKVMFRFNVVGVKADQHVRYGCCGECLHKIETAVTVVNNKVELYEVQFCINCRQPYCRRVGTRLIKNREHWECAICLGSPVPDAPSFLSEFAATARRYEKRTEPARVYDHSAVRFSFVSANSDPCV